MKKPQTPRLERGHKTVRCRECGAEGTVRVGRQLARSRVKAGISVEHLPHCPAYKPDQPSHLKKKRWTQQEKQANALVGARETVASGAANEDADGRFFGHWRVESKGTVKSSYTLTGAVWAKLVVGALRAGEEPILHVRIGRSTAVERDLVIVRTDFFDAAMGKTGWRVREAPQNRNAKSFRLTLDVETPYLVQLVPLAIAVTEHQFKELKELVDEAQESEDLQRAGEADAEDQDDLVGGADSA